MNEVCLLEFRINPLDGAMDLEFQRFVRFLKRVKVLNLVVPWWCAHLILALEVEASRSLSWRPALIA